MRSTWMLAACLAAGAALADETKPLIAVLEFRTKLAAEEKADADPTYFSDVVRSQALDELPMAQVMTRENMTVLLAASGKDLAQCEGECDVETGRNLGADEVINGELLKVGSSFKLDLKLHSTRDGRLLAGVQASGKTVDELDAAMPAAVSKLLAPLHPAPASGTAPAAAAGPAAPAASAAAPRAQVAPASPASTASNAARPAPPAAPSSTASPGPGAARANPLVTNSSAPFPRAATPASAPSPYRLIRVVDERIVHLQPFFAPGQRDLGRDAMAVLREVALALRGPPERRAAIICRNELETRASKRIALQRAWALRHALVELGVSRWGLLPRAEDAATQAKLVTQVAHPYVCEIVLR